MDYVHLLKKRGLRGKNIKSELGIMINWCHLVSKFVLLLVKEYGKPQKSSSLTLPSLKLQFNYNNKKLLRFCFFFLLF